MSIPFTVGKTGFEPATLPTPRSGCATRLAEKNKVEVISVSRLKIKKQLQKKLLFKGREDRIRTCDPLVPNQVRYRPALLPVPVSLSA